MVKGKIKKELPSVETILSRTTGGYDVFKYYLGNVSRIMSRPWGRKEKHNSWGLFYKSNCWFYKDQANEEVGTCIHFVQKYFGLDYPDAIRKIAWDFGIEQGQKINATPVKITWDKPDIENDYCDINPITSRFEQRHHSFWNILEVNEDHCKKMNCFAIKKLAIKNRIVPIRSTEAVFGYWCEEEKGWKIYFPDRDKSKRFKNNVSGSYLWNYSNMKECDDLIVQKSNKDLIVTTMITPCVVATQNESVGIFDTEMVRKINKISKSPWIWYGSDPDGVTKCTKITGMNKWKYINTPKNMLPDVNDAAEFVKWHNLQKMGTGLRELENFMKSKKLIK